MIVYIKLFYTCHWIKTCHVGARNQLWKSYLTEFEQLLERLEKIMWFFSKKKNGHCDIFLRIILKSTATSSTILYVYYKNKPKAQWKYIKQGINLVDSRLPVI